MPAARTVFLKLTARLGPLLLIGFFVSLAACMHSSPEARTDGSQDEDPFAQSDGERETVLIEPPEASERFEVMPAVFDTAVVKVDAQSGIPAIVDVLVKGSFPEGCFELNELDQEPMTGGQRVSLTMRRPQEAMCTQVVRPYRFFFTLDRRFESGRYTLRINDRSYAFEVTHAKR